MEERLRSGPAWEEHGLVFTNRYGGPIEPRTLNHVFVRLCEAAGLGKTRFHDLRHTCASLLLAQAVQPRVVMEILGHSGIGITMDTYSHVLPVLERDAANQMDKMLRG